MAGGELPDRRGLPDTVDPDHQYHPWPTFCRRGLVGTKQLDDALAQGVRPFLAALQPCTEPLDHRLRGAAPDVGSDQGFFRGRKLLIETTSLSFGDSA